MRARYILIWVVLALIIFLIALAQVKAPCSSYRNMPNKDIPSRCLQNYNLEGN